MPRRLLLPSLLCLSAFLSGCGGGPGVPIPYALGPFPNLPGNWQFQNSAPPAAGVPAANGILLTGSLVQTGSNISGLLLFEDLRSPLNPCAPHPTTAAIAGTVSSKGAVHLTSAIGGGTASIEFDNSGAVLKPFLDATITITGGSCAAAATASLAALIPNISGTYSGPILLKNFVTSATSAGTATLQLAQLDTPNASGQFPVSAMFTVASAVCDQTATMSGQAGGLGFQLTAPNSDTPQFPLATIYGGTDPAVPGVGATIAGGFSTGPCMDNEMSGQLLTAK